MIGSNGKANGVPIVGAVFVILVVGCGDTERQQAPGEEIFLPSAHEASAEGMTTSVVCSDCHSNDSNSSAMRDSEGREIGFYDLWRASMKANAARDPFWRAMVSAEVEATPAASEKIQQKCMTCHSPLGHTAAERRGEKLTLDVLQESDDLAHLSRDGVSCTLCHQTRPDNFGEESSFTGGFEIGEGDKIYGPQPDPFTRPMERRTGYTPTESDHLRDSGLCATCHTLETTPLEPSGEPAAEHTFPEQTPYLEWQNSSYGDGGDDQTSCQGCHVPQTDRDGQSIAMRIARRPNGGDFRPIGERSPVGRHLFIGGNTVVPRILRDHDEVLNPQAPPEAFDRLIAAVRRQLSEETADVTIPEAEVVDGKVTAEVAVENKTGHKFPTGFPSRRAWLHLRVTDADDSLVFESGAWDEEGHILGASGQPLASEEVGNPTAPHHREITAPDEVQIYEAVMAGVGGEPTYRLMRASEYFKDNRLLPTGWSDSFEKIDRIEPIGTGDDSNFGAGGDRITYRISLPSGAARPLQIEAEMVYQPISARFAAETFEIDTREVRVFRKYWRDLDRSPDPVDEATVEVR